MQQSARSNCTQINDCLLLLTVCPSIVLMRGCQGSFKTPPSVQSASMVSDPETLIPFSLTSERFGSNRMVNALRYLLRPVTSFVGSTNLHNPASHSHCADANANRKLAVHGCADVIWLKQTMTAIRHLPAIISKDLRCQVSCDKILSFC